MLTEKIKVNLLKEVLSFLSAAEMPDLNFNDVL